MTMRTAALAGIAVLAASTARAAEPSYAQHLLETMSGQRGVLGMAIDVNKPGADTITVVASTPDSLGAAAAAAQAIATAKAGRIAVVGAGSGHPEVFLPLLDVSRHPLGVVEVALARKPGEADSALKARAVAERDRLARRIANLNNLLEPARFDPDIAFDTYGQHLLDAAMAQNPQVIIMAMHATPSKAKDDVIVASNIGRLGKKADSDDMEVITTGVSRLEINEGKDRFEVEEVLKDVSGDTIGAIGVVFPYRAGDDQQGRRIQAEAIRDALARRIAHARNLLDPWPYDKRYNDHTYAQWLVDHTLAAHPETIILAVHATPPSSNVNVILGSNIGRIGKPADEDDLRVIEKGEVNKEIDETGRRFEGELPLNDATGRRIGALGVVFNYKPGDDKEALAARAARIRDEMAAQIPTAARLSQPAP